MGITRRDRPFPFLKPRGHCNLKKRCFVSYLTYGVLYPYEGGLNPRDYWSIEFFNRETGHTLTVMDVKELIDKLKKERERGELNEKDRITLEALEGKTIFELMLRWAKYFSKRPRYKLFYSLACDILSNKKEIWNQTLNPDLKF